MKSCSTSMYPFKKPFYLLVMSLSILPMNARAAKPEKVNIPENAVHYEKTGTWVYYEGKKQVVLYENQFKKAEGNISEDKRDGKWTFWYDNGNLKGEGNYEKGTMTGPWKLYFTTGTLKAEGNYKNSLKDGTWNFYYSSGIKKSTGTFLAGVKHGPWAEYYENGQIFFNGNYKYGFADGHWDFFFSSGKLYQSGSYIEDRKEGEWKICIYPDTPCQTQIISRPGIPGTTGLAPADDSGLPKVKDDAGSILKSMDDENSRVDSRWGE